MLILGHCNVGGEASKNAVVCEFGTGFGPGSASSAWRVVRPVKLAGRKRGQGVFCGPFFRRGLALSKGEHGAIRGAGDYAR